jgi:LPS-assembly protein
LPFRVDPALLGLPPVVEPGQASLFVMETVQSPTAFSPMAKFQENESAGAGETGAGSSGVDISGEPSPAPSIAEEVGVPVEKNNRPVGASGITAPEKDVPQALVDGMLEDSSRETSTFPEEISDSRFHAENEIPGIGDDFPPPVLKLSKTLALPPEGNSGNDRPIFLVADRVDGDGRREINAKGAAELRKHGMIVTADRLTYWPVEDEIEGEGNARLEQGQGTVSGPKMRMKMDDKVGFFEKPSFFVRQEPKNTAVNQFWQRDEEDSSGFAPPMMIDLKRRNSRAIAQTYSPVRGDADRLDLEGENHYNMTNARFTTCSPGNDDWYFKAGELRLDLDKERGRGKDATFYFKNIPVFYSPILPFPLSNARASGFLAPSFITASNVGVSVRLPYYWNIAPNMDAVVTSQLLAKHGVLLDSEFRYFNRARGGIYRGQARLSVLPSDRLRDGDNRYGISLTHTQYTADGFSGQINFNKVSDNQFFTDLSSNISMTSQAQLLQQAAISYYGGGWWNATANFQQYQTLQVDSKNPVVEQYKMLPQFTFNARKPDFYGTDSSFIGQYTSFSRPKQIIGGVLIDPPVGHRLVLYPQMALPLVMPGWHVTPKVGLNMRRYSLSGGPASQPKTININLPVFSVDSGMTFERKSNWFGRDYTQTLEPRLYYLNIPYRDQSMIPVFDTGLADFNFAQIFSENQFSSWDRISNANQLTAGFTSRLLDHRNGAEIMRLMLGQRFYFTKSRVGLYEDPTQLDENRKWDKSDFLASFSGQIYPRLYADVSTQYNISDRLAKRHSIGIRYLPEPGKVFNAAYRYNRDPASPLNQVDFSAQWPISKRLYAVGRLNYSLKDTGAVLSTASQTGRVVQAVAGVEYKGGCWVLRGVMQRLALTQNSASSAFFVQLELNDFASVGSNPILILRRNIQGYSLINEPTPGSLLE